MKNSTYCGFGKSVFLKPPYWAFIDSSCEIHDNNYIIGGTRADRLKADFGFLQHMLKDFKELPYKKKRRATRIAITYYILVRLFGWISFNHD